MSEQGLRQFLIEQYACARVNAKLNNGEDEPYYNGVMWSMCRVWGKLTGHNDLPYFSDLYVNDNQKETTT